jgi:hypothetical protein
MPSTMHLQLGSRRFDLRERPVVVGILNRTRDSFFDRGAYYALDRLLEQAERLVVGGADVLEVGARPGGVGVAGVGPEEERDLAASTIAALRARLDLPLAVDTTRAAVAAAAFAEGAVLGNDMSGFRDPGYLPTAAAAGAAVVATHIRLPPGVPDPQPVYGDLLGEVRARPGPRHRPRQDLAAVPAAARPAGRHPVPRSPRPRRRVQQDVPAPRALTTRRSTSRPRPRARSARCAATSSSACTTPGSAGRPQTSPMRCAQHDPDRPRGPRGQLVRTTSRCVARVIAT